ncbi:calcium-binding protein [Algisphaera agarilytica]|uniref:Ca2+-binding RTX toxin-like protein n=1 Tax=Algisphaera agarilytica TaxID=1385975 RepID=A0A7X0H6E1_9BACT|nr:calcium-binding protein [Algisphaera agarilytica]MBB6430133.1 Ca2+-binding RTX toxin-like protein [Algisphaera agarilytica]
MSTFEPLEARELMSASAFLSGSTLYVTGDSGNNGISVTTADRGATLEVSEYRWGSGYRPIYSVASSRVGEILMYGGAGDDTLSIGTDIVKRATIEGGRGADYLFGGAGITRIVGNGDAGGSGLAENDTLVARAGLTYLYGEGGNDTLINQTRSTFSMTYMYGGAGNDRMIGSDYGGTYAKGDAGNDTAVVKRGAFEFRGGDGRDMADYSAWTTDVRIDLNGSRNSGDRWGAKKHRLHNDIEAAKGGSGNDFIRGNAGFNWLYGNAGNDHIEAGYGNLTARIWGGAGNDYIIGGNANDHIWGDSGNDTIIGGNGNDSLVGGLGNDTLIGGNGNDRMYGQWGYDTMIGGEGDDEAPDRGWDGDYWVL